MVEKQLHGSEKFITAVMEEIKPIIETMVNEEISLKVMKNLLFDEPGPRYMGIRLSPREQALKKILSGFSEIDTSFEVLNDILVYIKRFPPKSSSISKTRFLNYHVGNYFNEVYILRERLAAFQKVITRMYKKDRRLVQMGKQIKNLETLIMGFESIIATRGRHVHQERYSDDDFARLALFENINNEDVQSVPLFGELYLLALRKARGKWTKIISDNNENIKKLLDLYFDILYVVIFDKNGKFIDPNAI